MARSSPTLKMLILLLFTLFTTIVHSCIPPFNDWRYVDNTTLFDEAVAETLSNLEFGSANGLGRLSPLKRWPINFQDVWVNIPYCFVDQYSKKHLYNIFYRAQRLWLDALGTPGRKTGHRMTGFVQFHKESDGSIPFCFTDFKNKVWNPDVPKHVLAVDANVGTTATSWATLGYIPEEWDSSAYRHRMFIAYFQGLDEHHSAHTVAHEMGHVFGFMHEHQRPDRDHYVHFECKNIVGYDQAKAYLEEHKPSGIDMEKLCSSSVLSRTAPFAQFGFSAFDFSKEPFIDSNKKDGDKHPITVTPDAHYDLDSIMHYRSDAYQKPDNPNNVKNAPLAFWKKGAPDYNPPKEVTDDNAKIYLPELVKPSKADLSALKRLYPWVGKPVSQGSS